MRRSRGFSTTASFEIGELEYEVDLTYRPGSPASYDDPGDGGETETGRFVSISAGGHLLGYVPYDVFLLDFQSFRMREWGAGRIDKPGQIDDYVADLCHEAAETAYAEQDPIEDDRGDVDWERDTSIYDND